MNVPPTFGEAPERYCTEPCCELARVSKSAVEVTSEIQLREVLTRPEVFWWPTRKDRP